MSSNPLAYLVFLLLPSILIYLIYNGYNNKNNAHHANRKNHGLNHVVKKAQIANANNIENHILLCGFSFFSIISFFFISIMFQHLGHFPFFQIYSSFTLKFELHSGQVIFISISTFII